MEYTEWSQQSGFETLDTFCDFLDSVNCLAPGYDGAEFGPEPLVVPVVHSGDTTDESSSDDEADQQDDEDAQEAAIMSLSAANREKAEADVLEMLEPNDYFYRQDEVDVVLSTGKSRMGASMSH
jgi:hypothetical protein